MDSRDNVREENCLDSQLWHAFAGSMVKMPAVNSIVFYFPQGHAEHAGVSVEFRSEIRIPSYIPCRVSGITFMAERETDEVFAKISLKPVSPNELFEVVDDEMAVKIGSDNSDKPLSFAKTLTQSDANNGGGFSVPKYCADTIFPPLDYTANPPVQTLLAKDVHGKTWKFRHIFRGTPERHLLTTGWSSFVNEKKLVAGDSIVFVRDENNDIYVGIRRIKKKGVSGGPETSPWWIPPVGKFSIPQGGFSAFLRNDENTNSSWKLMNKGKMKAESVIEAANLAANRHPFEVTFYPRTSTPEFFVKASRVKAALQIHWCSGMRFKMPFETEDSVISWFMGTICSVQVADPTRWPDSPWRILQVTWDEPNLLHNVMCVNPWLVELVSNMPTINFNPYTSPLKKIRLSHHSDFSLDGHLPMTGFSGDHLDFPLDGNLPLPSFLGNDLVRPNGPFRCLPTDTPVGMQGARHAPFSLSLPNLHPNKLHNDFPSLHYVAAAPSTSNNTMISKPNGSEGARHAPCSLSLSNLHPNKLHNDFPSLHHVAAAPSTSNNTMISKPNSSDDVSCLLALGNSTQTVKKFDHEKAPQFVLFGQPIVIEQQISPSNSGNSVSLIRPTNNFSDGNECKKDNISEESGIEISGILNDVIYRDIIGAVKQLDEPFSDFTKIKRKLTILTDGSSDNIRVRE